MAHERFTTLLIVTSAVMTAALLTGVSAVRSGGTAMIVVATLCGVVAFAGIVVLGRVVVVTERARRQQ